MASKIVTAYVSNSPWTGVGLELQVLPLNRGLANVARRPASDPRRRAHEEPPARSVALRVVAAKLCGRDSVRAVTARICCSSSNSSSCAVLAGARRTFRRATGCCADPGRCFSVRDASKRSLSPSALRRSWRFIGFGASQIRPALFVFVLPEEARPERARPDTHPGHCRTKVAQSSVWLFTDCAHHRRRSGRRRQERRLSRAIETPSPGSERAFVVVVHRPHQ